jgi:hypothetical protein
VVRVPGKSPYIVDDEWRSGTANRALDQQWTGETWFFVPKPTKARCLEYDMSEFLASCVERYKELGGKLAQNLRRVDTPSIDVKRETYTHGSGARPPAKAKRKADTEDSESEEEPAEPSGELGPIAARVLMKVLYAARMCRYDLLRTFCYLATRITKWTATCDKALHRLMCYINSTLHLRMSA